MKLKTIVILVVIVGAIWGVGYLIDNEIGADLITNMFNTQELETRLAPNSN